MLITPKVSVVIPVYNAEQYIAQGLQSLKAQSLKEIEVIMVNDGSTDRSESICKSFADEDARFILINQENGGSAAARKTGMLAAHGEYIGFMDADDWCEPRMFQTLYEVGHAKNIDIVFCNCFRDYPDRSIQCKKQIRDGYYDRKQIEEEILPRTLAGLNSKGETNVIRWANYIRIYRRSLIETYGVYNDPRFRRCQDLQLTFEATLHAQSYYYLGDEYLYHNRVVTNSQSRGYTKNQWQKLRILIERLYQDVEQFTAIDLRDQMDLCTFFFAVYSCENEGRECKGLTAADRREHIKDICDDLLCQTCLNTIPYGQLSKANQLYFNALKARDVDLVLTANEYREKVRKISEAKGRVLKMPMVMTIYNVLRKISKR